MAPRIFGGATVGNGGGVLYNPPPPGTPTYRIDVWAGGGVWLEHVRAGGAGLARAGVRAGGGSGWNISMVRIFFLNRTHARARGGAARTWLGKIEIFY